MSRKMLSLAAAVAVTVALSVGGQQADAGLFDFLSGGDNCAPPAKTVSCKSDGLLGSSGGLLGGLFNGGNNCKPVKASRCRPAAPTCCKPAATCCTPAAACSSGATDGAGEAPPAPKVEDAPAPPKEDKPPAPKKA